MVVHPSSDTKSVFIRDAACDVKGVRESLPRSLWETYSAFANTDGGTIVLGVVEDDEKGMVIEGVPDVQGTLNGLWNVLNNTEKVSANLLTDSDVVITVSMGRNSSLSGYHARTAKTVPCSSTAIHATPSEETGKGITDAPQTRSTR